MILLATVMLTESNTYPMHKEATKAQHKTASEPKSAHELTPEQRLVQRRLNRGQFVSSHAAVKSHTKDIEDDAHPAVHRNITPDPVFGALLQPHVEQSRSNTINGAWVKSDATAQRTIDMVLDHCIDLHTLNLLLITAVHEKSPQNVKTLLRMGANPLFKSDKYDMAQTGVLNKVFPVNQNHSYRLKQLNALFNKKRVQLSKEDKDVVAETQQRFDKCTEEEQSLLKIIDSLSDYQVKRASLK
jgi:hypothetical protein